MITILSPATTMNFDKSLNTPQSSNPHFKNEINNLISILKNLNKDEIKNLMNLSDDLTNLNYDRYKILGCHNSIKKEALLAFDGQVFNCINIDDFTLDDFSFANNNIKILSGLYGILNPLDLIESYRLEMKAKLENECGNDLYKFWKDKLTNYLKNQLENQEEKTLVNLASNEYSKAINLKEISKEFKVINIEFKEYKENLDSYKVIGLYSKKARGLMTRFIVKNRIDKCEDLKSFNEDGYSFNKLLSDDNNWIYTR